MAFALLIAIWLLTLGTAYLFNHNWLPAAASTNAAVTDHQLWLNFAVVGSVFVLTQITLGIFVWRYRAKAHHPAEKPTNTTPAELFAMLAAAAIFIGLNVAGGRMLSGTEFLGHSPQAEPVRVEVTGVQFRWYFRYPGVDGRFGATNPALIDASLGNPLGIDSRDPAARDDRVTSTLVIPEGKDVELTLRAQDVIHSFFVPALRLKQDAVPGTEMHIHFSAQKPGTYEIACAELCGLGHYSMNARLMVMSAQEYRSYAQVAQK